MTHAEISISTNVFAELGRIKVTDVDINAMLDKVARLAQRTVPGASEVSVTLLRGGNVHTETVTGAFTGALAAELDLWQYDHGRGPCLHAATDTVDVSVPDMSAEQRWPDWARTAQQAGACSSLSLALPVHEQVTGALNLYATRPHAFDDDAISLARTLAAYAAVALCNIHLYETQVEMAGHLQRAMDSRATIEQAKGIIMADRRCTPDEAFAILRKLSQDTNCKLRDVATAMVTEAPRTHWHDPHGAGR